MSYEVKGSNTKAPIFGPNPQPYKKAETVKVAGEHRTDRFLLSHTPGTAEYKSHHVDQKVNERKEALADKAKTNAEVAEKTKDIKVRHEYEKLQTEQAKKRELTAKAQKEDAQKERTKYLIEKSKGEHKTDFTVKTKEPSQAREPSGVTKNDLEAADFWMNDPANKRVVEEAEQHNRRGELRRVVAEKYNKGEHPSQSDLYSNITSDKPIKESLEDNRDSK